MVTNVPQSHTTIDVTFGKDIFYLRDILYEKETNTDAKFIHKNGSSMLAWFLKKMLHFVFLVNFCFHELLLFCLSFLSQSSLPFSLRFSIFSLSFFVYFFLFLSLSYLSFLSPARPDYCSCHLIRSGKWTQIIKLWKGL
jgi:hypothetical protein